ncbi:hypothetical protein E4U35_008167 [Claviceps purpurea]|nr:hypothetical protein E4U35_008167 [Claviceps purpurea]KAG6256759.1 hypothetical protein E4U23_000972 [Claviceps purpurea]
MPLGREDIDNDCPLAKPSKQGRKEHSVRSEVRTGANANSSEPCWVPGQSSGFVPSRPELSLEFYF